MASADASVRRFDTGNGGRTKGGLFRERPFLTLLQFEHTLAIGVQIRLEIQQKPLHRSVGPVGGRVLMTEVFKITGVGGPTNPQTLTNSPMIA